MILLTSHTSFWDSNDSLVIMINDIIYGVISMVQTLNSTFPFSTFYLSKNKKHKSFQHYFIGAS